MTSRRSSRRARPSRSPRIPPTAPRSGTVVATDGDVTATTFQNWTITGGTGATAFAIDAVTGEITVADSAPLDFETTTSFTLQVTVSDGINTSAAQSVTVNLTDANEAPTATNLMQTQAYAEGAASVAVTPIVVTDADASDQITATLTLNNPAAGGAQRNDGADLRRRHRRLDDHRHGNQCQHRPGQRAIPAGRGQRPRHGRHRPDPRRGGHRASRRHHHPGRGARQRPTSAGAPSVTSPSTKARR